MALPVCIWTQVRLPQTLPAIPALGACIVLGSMLLISTAQWLRRRGAQTAKAVVWGVPYG